MKVLGLLVSVLLLTNCSTNSYDFDYDSEKILYGVGNSKPGSNFGTMPLFMDNPAMYKERYENPAAGAGANAAPATTQSVNPAQTQRYQNPYANPTGVTPYSTNKPTSVNTQPQMGTNAPSGASNQASPYSGYYNSPSKNQLYNMPSQYYNQNTGQVQGGYQQNQSQSNSRYNAKKEDKYRGLTQTNKTEAIDRNIFTENDRQRFGLIQEDTFSANNNFERYRPMYEKKTSKQTQDFVDSLQGSLLEQMIQNDPVSNGFGLDNIPSY